MPATKLTLSADTRVVSLAKRIAKQRHTSVSAMFAQFITGMAEADDDAGEPLAPHARRALGMAATKSKRSDRELLADALLKRYDS